MLIDKKKVDKILFDARTVNKIYIGTDLAYAADDILSYTYNDSNHTANVTGLISGVISPVTVTIQKNIIHNSQWYTVTSIGDSAFRRCSKLTSITIPDSVTSIGEYAFNNCSGLTSVTIGSGVKSIREYTFANCSSLTSITIGNSVMSIREFAFSGCSSLTSIIIPDSVTSIGDNAFAGCSKLTSVTIPDSVTSIGVDAFYNCSSLTNVTIGNGLTSIADELFMDCTSLTSIIIPDNVTSIGARALSGCRSLTSITIPFVGNREITMAYPNQYPLGIIFGTYSYDGGTAVTQYYYGINPAIRTSNTFYIPSNLSTVKILGGYIPSGSFGYCDMLTSIEIGNGTTQLGPLITEGCDNIETIIIGANVSNISERAFNNMGTTKTTTYQLVPLTPPTLGDFAFTTANINKILVPAASLNAYKNATNWSNYQNKMEGY